jgi:hypothetical protein
MGEVRDKADNFIQAAYLHPMNATQLKQLEDQRWKAADHLLAVARIFKPKQVTYAASAKVDLYLMNTHKELGVFLQDVSDIIP